MSKVLGLLDWRTLMKKEIKIKLDPENAKKIIGIKAMYKELDFKYLPNDNDIINLLIKNKRPLICAKDKEHKKNLLHYYWYEQNKDKITVDFKDLGYYMIYDNENDLEFKPCKLHDFYYKKLEWIYEE